ncbi:uncharacterized protein C1orf127 homolog [Coregonus clupeaformis]|uniref:uncharacterized protein C1orf127 homolog n=1 Tax=Coregonus clupeaformis TaxID=59861 RepID=UPI001E1C2B5A|nr:uncharacterized protein C1orf127 homolog [Coregonus clupeaformis]
MYNGCFVQHQHGSNVLVLNLVKRINRFGDRTHSFIMKCPMVPAPPNREHIQCDPDDIQVIRQIPLDSWNNELQWSLSLRGNLIVALEDASLIQVYTDMNGPSIIVQGKRRELLNPVTVMERTGEFLALKLVSGQYAYSMEATCPNVVSVSSPAAEDTILHIFKRRMGLTKRGGYESDTLTVSSVSVKQTEKFTVHETHDFVQLSIATALILQVKNCPTDEGIAQPFYRVDVVLTFKETNHKMYWTMENTLPCTESPRLLSISPIYYHTSTTSDPILTYTTSTPASYTTVPFSSHSTMDQQFLSTEKSQEGPSTFPKTTSIERTQAEETGRNTSPTSSSHTQTSGPIIYWSNVTSMTPSTTNKATKDKYQQTSTISEATQVEFQGTTATSATVQVEFQGTTVTSETALVEFQGPTSTTDTIQSRFQGTSGTSETVQEEFQATTIASGTMHVEFQETTITSETARVEFQGTTITSETAQVEFQ